MMNTLKGRKEKKKALERNMYRWIHGRIHRSGGCISIVFDWYSARKRIERGEDKSKTLILHRSRGEIKLNIYV